MREEHIEIVGSGSPMRARTLLAAGLCLYVLAVVSAPIDAQRAGAFRGSTEDPAIKYSTAPLNNARRRRQPQAPGRRVQLTFEGRSGFLRSALDALQIPVDSQLLVFSRASLQGKQISEQNPRALFFNDRVALGWVRGGDIIEVAAHDESAGVVFYTLDQRADAAEPAAVQARLHLSRVSHGRRYARRARPPDVQHHAPGSLAGIQPSAFRRSERLAGTTVRRLVRDRQHRLGDAHGQ